MSGASARHGFRPRLLSVMRQAQDIRVQTLNHLFDEIGSLGGQDTLVQKGEGGQVQKKVEIMECVTKEVLQTRQPP